MEDLTLTMEHHDKEPFTLEDVSVPPQIPVEPDLEIFLVVSPNLADPPVPIEYEHRRDETYAFRKGVTTVQVFYRQALHSLLCQFLGQFLRSFSFLDLYALLNNEVELRDKFGSALVVWDHDITEHHLRTLMARFGSKSWSNMIVAMKVVYRKPGAANLEFACSSLSEYVATLDD